MDALFDVVSEPTIDTGLFVKESCAGRADGLGMARYGIGAREVTYLRANGGKPVTGEWWSDGPDEGTAWVHCEKSYAQRGAVVVDMSTFREVKNHSGETT